MSGLEDALDMGGEEQIVSMFLACINSVDGDTIL